MKERNLTDVLHVYFADAANNHCECEECRKLIPTDYLVMLLNELDEAFTENGIETKILFPVYVDVLWPPMKTKFKNPDRFIMEAYLSRNYSLPLPEKKTRKIPEYILNDYNPYRGEAKTTLDFVEAWKPYFDKPFITGSYDIYSDHFYDPGYFQVSRRIADDIKRLPEFGCMGKIDCQTMRYGFPNALPCSVMGDFTFDGTLKFDEYTDRYFKGAYGKDWKIAREYLEKITELFSPCNLRMSEDVVVQDTDEDAEVEMLQSYIGNEDVQKKLSMVSEFVDGFREMIDRNLDTKNACHNRSWNYLELHGKYCKLYSKYFLELSKLDVESAYETGEQLMKWLFENEDYLGRHFDIYLLNLRVVRITVIRMRRKLGLPDTIKLGEF